MAIISVDDYIASTKQNIRYLKTGARTTVAAGWFSLLDVAGAPGAGTLAGTSTTAGVVPTASTAGCPFLNTFGALTGYVTRIAYGSTVACRVALFDLLWKGGAYAFNANTALSSQPSFSGRLPGTDYKGLEIWAEQVTAATGNQTVNVTYTDQDGNTGATTGAVGIGAAPTVGRCWPLPLASGDSGVQTITNVAGGTGSAGTFNVLVLRRLWEGRVQTINGGGVDDIARLGPPRIYDTSALFALVSTDATASGVPDLGIEVAYY